MACFKLGKQFRAEKKIDPDEDREIKTPVPDPFIESNHVVGLDTNNFQHFLKTKEIAMVMFYEMQNSQSRWSRRHFRKAAEVTSRPGHAYAAVDCDKEGDFCINVGVPNLPYFMIFSKGKRVNVFHFDPRTFLYQDMKKWVEGLPVSKIT